MKLPVHAAIVIAALLSVCACGGGQDQSSSDGSFRQSYAKSFVQSCTAPKPGDRVLANGCVCLINDILAKYPSTSELTAVSAQLNARIVPPDVRPMLAKCFPRPKRER